MSLPLCLSSLADWLIYWGSAMIKRTPASVPDPMYAPPAVSAQSSARDRLLASAQRLLWELGYDAMSPRMVLEDSGVGQGSLYHHFKTKKDLAHAALEGITDSLIARADEILRASERPPLQRIKDWLSVPRDALKGCRVGRLVNEQAIHDAAIGDPVGRYFVAVQAALRDALEDARQKGELHPDVDVVAVAAMLVAAVQGGYVLARGSGDPAALHVALKGAWQVLEGMAGEKYQKQG